jgi:hypothetical protein
MATTAGGEKLYTDAPDERAVLFYKNYTQLAEASEADRPALGDVYEQLLDSIAGASVLYKSRAAEVSVEAVIDRIAVVPPLLCRNVH